MNLIDILLNCLENAIGARVFVKYMTEADIDSSELNFTFGGKKVLKRLKEVCYDKTEELCLSKPIYALTTGVVCEY